MEGEQYNIITEERKETMPRPVKQREPVKLFKDPAPATRQDATFCYILCGIGAPGQRFRLTLDDVGNLQSHIQGLLKQE